MTYRHPLHEKLLKGGWPSVQTLIGQQETVDLDFKNKVDPKTGVFDKNERQVLGPLMSAFANSMGGMSVIGIDCRKNADNVDEAVGINPITGLRRFVSDLNTNIPNLAMSRLEDVSVDLIENPSTPDSGVVVVSVARSERRPHRCETAGDKQYYKRSGSNTVPMEHFEIEDAFRRLSVAKLELDEPIRVRSGAAGNTHVYYLSFRLRNVSNMTAKFPFVEIVKARGATVSAFGIDGNRTFLLPPVERNRLRAFAGGADRVIHPGQTIEVFRLVFHVQIPSGEVNWQDEHPTWPNGFRSAEDWLLDIEVKIACENAPLMTQTFFYKGTDLADLTKPLPPSQPKPAGPQR